MSYGIRSCIYSHSRFKCYGNNKREEITQFSGAGFGVLYIYRCVIFVLYRMWNLVLISLFARDDDGSFLLFFITVVHMLVIMEWNVMVLRGYSSEILFSPLLCEGDVSQNYLGGTGHVAFKLVLYSLCSRFFGFFRCGLCIWNLWTYLLDRYWRYYSLCVFSRFCKL